MKCMMMTSDVLVKTKQPIYEIVRTKTDLYLVYNGIRIAKRGHPNTQQAGTWVSLEPGFTVLDSIDGTELIIQEPSHH